MTTEQKEVKVEYVTPLPEEMFQGAEYEVLQKEGSWIPAIFDHLDPTTSIRMKRLDDKDMEELGFTKVRGAQGKKVYQKGSLYVYFSMTRGLTEILRNGITLFLGYIGNKSELQRQFSIIRHYENVTKLQAWQDNQDSL
jgi:hypothetical protein